MIDPTKDNFTHLLSVKEIFDDLEISEDDYYRGLSVSKDEQIELHLKRKPNSSFVNSYFDVGLKALQANMDIQHVFNDYKVATYTTYMCQYFSKTEDQCSQAEKKAVIENNMHHRDIMKAIPKAYLSKLYFSRIEAKENLFGCVFS